MTNACKTIIEFNKCSYFKNESSQTNSQFKIGVSPCIDYA